MIRRFALLFALLLAAGCGGPGADEAVDAESGETAVIADLGGVPDAVADLEAQVAALYDDPFAVDPLDPPLPLTEELAALFAAERAAADANDGLPPVLDFAWHVDGQDAEISELVVSHESIAPGMVAVIARFRNFGEPKMVRYVWAEQGGEWRLADIVIGDAEDAMAVTLSESLTAR